MAAMTEPTRRQINAAGIAVELRRGGKGAPLLVIHGELGVPGWLESFARLAEALRCDRSVAARLWRIDPARLDHGRARSRRLGDLVRPRSRPHSAGECDRLLAWRMGRRRNRNGRAAVL